MSSKVERQYNENKCELKAYKIRKSWNVINDIIGKLKEFKNMSLKIN